VPTTSSGRNPGVSRRVARLRLLLRRSSCAKVIPTGAMALTSATRANRVSVVLMTRPAQVIDTSSSSVRGRDVLDRLCELIQGEDQLPSTAAVLVAHFAHTFQYRSRSARPQWEAPWLRT